MRILFFSLLFLSSQIGLQGQSVSKRAAAVRVQKGPKLDGILSDSAWQLTSVMTDFVQVFPNYGKPAPSAATVRIVYDDEAIYVGAELSDDPKMIRKQFTPRDAEGQADVDFFSIFFGMYPCITEKLLVPPGLRKLSRISLAALSDLPWTV